MSQIVVIGLGRFGFHVAKQLHLAGHEVLAIDVDPHTVDEIREHCSRAIVLDAREKERIEALGIADFDVAVISLGERVDVSSLIALHLKELGVKRLITKAGSEDHGKLLRLIGVDQVIFPEREAAERLASRLTASNLLEFVPLGEEYSIHEIAPPDRFVGCTLEELKLRNRFGIQVIGVRDVLTGNVLLNPGPAFRVKDSDALVVLGRNEDLVRLRKV